MSSTIPQIRAALVGEGSNYFSSAGWNYDQNFISLINIPSKLYGNNIEPQSFNLSFNDPTAYSHTRTVIDDGNGNLRQFSTNGAFDFNGAYCGNIIYEHGMVILTPVSESWDGSPTTNPYLSDGGVSNLGAIILNNQNGYTAGDDYFSGSIVGFSSSITLYEHQYKCVVRENEFGYSLNPSLLSGSQSEAPLLGTNYVYKDFATGSYFSPYITTVGLYDNDQNLLAIGKLSTPTKVPMDADLEIQVAFDSI